MSEVPAALLQVTDLTKVYGRKRARRATRDEVAVRALNSVTFSIRAGESFGLIGESGSGKSTTARCVLGLETPTEGKVMLAGKSVRPRSGADRLALARTVQAVFQDPMASLSPRMTMQSIVEEPLRVLSNATPTQRRRAASEALESVGLGQAICGRYRHQLSGGQQQRVSIARAFISAPRLVVLDEPVSALDASVRGQVLILLSGLRETTGVSYLSISHDLGTVRSTCERVGVMCRGYLLEMGPVEKVFSSPQHEYTRSLLAASLESLDTGQSPGLVDVLTSDDVSPVGSLVLREVSSNHFVAVEAPDGTGQGGQCD